MISKLLSGEQILMRNPGSGDVHTMLEFINQLSNEDIYLNANPQNLFTVSQEQQYLDDCLARIERKMQVHLLAFHQEKLVGSVTITKQAMRQPHVGIFGITIALGWRGKGLGELLAKKALEQAKECAITLVILDAFTKNIPAINLYKKLGFKEYGMLPKGFSYKGQFEDKVLMYKELA